jgi:formamidopyrimidine-DNA glycosylase
VPRFKVPELPEVETVVRELRPRLVGRKFRSVEVSDKELRRPWKAEWAAQVSGRRVVAMHRRGKWIVIDLGDELSLVMHLGMSGQLTVTAASAPREDHTHVVFALDRGGEQLRFRDIRRFGSATLFTTRTALDGFFSTSGLGPEPFALPADYWRQQLKKTARNLKAVLLDQRVVAGVGNIYADEALFQAQLHPSRRGKSLTAAEAERLRLAIPPVLKKAIAKRGSTIRNYVGGSGLRGEYQNEFLVYGRTGQPCPNCGTPIAVTRLAGRSSHYCPRCQPAHRRRSAPPQPRP